MFDLESWQWTTAAAVAVVAVGTMSSQFPAMAGLLGSLPQLVPVFANVPPGLDHYKPLVDVMQANVTSYQQVDSLPSFDLFTWFFAIPGILLVLLAGIPLAMRLLGRGAGETA